MPETLKTQTGDERFKAIVELLGEPLWLLDAQNEPLYANRAARSVQERRPDVLTWAQTDTTLLIPNDAGDKCFWRGQRDALENGQSVLRLVEVSREAVLKEELRVLNERYTMLTEHAADVIWTMQLDGRFTYVSPTGKDLRGYGVEELLAQPISETILPEDYALVMGTLAERLKIEAQGIHETFAEHFDLRQYARDGGIIWTEVIVGPLRNDKHELIGVMGVTRNIDARKRAEEALRESEELFRSVVYNSTDLTTLTDANGVLTYLSPQCESVLGYAAETFLGQTLPDIIHPDDQAKCRQAWEQITSEGQEQHDFQYRILDAKGEIRWLSHSARLIRLRGETFGIQSTLRNITAQKQYEDALARRERDLRAILDTPNDYACLLDLTTNRVLESNEQLRNHLGVSREELAALDVRDFLKHKDWAERGEAIQRVLQNKCAFRFTDSRAGRRYENSLYPILDEAGKATRLVIFARDITEQQEAQENLTHYQQRLRALASQLTLAEERQRREFAIWLHDGIAQTLSALLLRLKLLRADHQPFEGPAAQSFEEILHDLERATQSARSLLFDLSPPLLYEVGFKAAIARLFEKLQSDLACDGSFRVTPQPLDLPHDRKVLLFQIFRELLNNVRKHSKASRVEGTVDLSEGAILFTLSDNGQGFDPQAAKQMSLERGGFGLFSIEERLRDIGGKITISTGPGQGTSVVVSVPSPT